MPIYLERLGLPWRLVPLDAGERLPADVTAISGLVFMAVVPFGTDEIAAAPGVQAIEAMQSNPAQRLAGLHAAPDRIYERWRQGWVR